MPLKHEDHREVHGHGVRVPSKHRKFSEKRLKRGFPLFCGSGPAPYYAHLGISFEDFAPMRRGCDIDAQVLSGRVPVHVAAVFQSLLPLTS